MKCASQLSIIDSLLKWGNNDYFKRNLSDGDWCWEIFPLLQGFAAKRVESLVKTLNMGNLYLKQFSDLLKKKSLKGRGLVDFALLIQNCDLPINVKGLRSFKKKLESWTKNSCIISGHGSQRSSLRSWSHTEADETAFPRGRMQQRPWGRKGAEDS